MLARKYPVRAVYPNKEQGQYLCTINGILHAEAGSMLAMRKDIASKVSQIKVKWTNISIVARIVSKNNLVYCYV